MQDIEILTPEGLAGAAPALVHSDAKDAATATTLGDRQPLPQMIEGAVRQAMELALAWHRGGQLPQAEDAYRAILELVPGHTDANHNLAVIALQSGHAAASVALFRRALDGQAGNETYWSSLFDALLQSGDVAGATDLLERRRRAGMGLAQANALIERIMVQRHTHAQQARPATRRNRNAPSPKQIGAIKTLFQDDKLEQVVERASALTRRCPDHPFGWKAMGAALVNLGRCDTALEPLLRAVERVPTDASALSNLGFALQNQGRPVEAEINLRLALLYRPEFAAAHINLGATMLSQDRYDDAALRFRRGLEIEPGYIPAHSHLAQVDEEKGRLVQALAGYRKTLELMAADTSLDHALRLRATRAYAHQGMSSTHAKLADFPAVLAHSDQALALQPDDAVLWEKRLYCLSYHPDLDVADIFAEFVRWGDRHARPVGDFSSHDRSSGRRIKVGYVSPDFRRHTSRFYFLPLFSNHDHAAFELHAYSNVRTEDEVTARFRTCFDHWHDINSLNDADAAAQMRADGIDILVDGCNHMRGDRLGIFALKPAPIQVTWLGAAWTTGLQAVDYVLFDRHLAPPETLAREQIVRLPRCFVPFQSLTETGLPQPPPSLRNGYVTFAYSGRSERLNHRTFRVWGEILRRMPSARLVLDYRNFAEPGNRDHFLGLMAAQGVDTGRVSLRNSPNIFEGLHDFDILLDCFPHSGGTMLVDALWMGVPVLTLAGRPPLGRIGTSFVTNIGLPEWVALDEMQYIEKACAFGSDTAALAELRCGMRERMLRSALMDAPGFARDVEAAYQIMWARFCAGQTPAPIALATPAGDLP